MKWNKNKWNKECVSETCLFGIRWIQNEEYSGFSIQHLWHNYHQKKNKNSLTFSLKAKKEKQKRDTFNGSELGQLVKVKILTVSIV